MTFFTDKYYIIRKGDFATNGNRKLLYCLFTFCMCVVDSITNTNDCFYIMFGSSAVWTLIEFSLYVTNTRKIKQMHLSYGGQTTTLSPYTGILLQGIQEGGVVTTFGLFFGDRIFNYKYLLVLHAFIFYIIRDVFYTTIDNTIDNTIGHEETNILSIRQINTNSSLLLMSSVTLYNIKALNDHPEHLYRQMKMLFVMIYVCSIWTIVAVYKKRRLVKIVTKGYSKHITFHDILFILGYDVVFEIGVAYLTFYNFFLL